MKLFYGLTPKYQMFRDELRNFKAISSQPDQKVIGQNIVRFDTKIVSNRELG